MAKNYYDTLLHDMGEARELAALIKECDGVEGVGVEGVGGNHGRWHVRAAVTEEAFLAIPHPVNRIYDFSNGDRQLQKDVGNVVYICNDKGCHIDATDHGKISRNTEKPYKIKK